MRLILKKKKIPVEDVIGVSDDVGRPSRRVLGGRKAKTKGSSFERRICKLFEPWWGAKFFRTPMSGGSQLKFDYNLAGDVCTPADDFSFHVECKNQEALGKFHNFLVSEKSAVWKWWKQCTDECPENQIPLLVFTKNHVPIWVMFEFRYLTGISNRPNEKFEYESMILTHGNVVITLDFFMRFSKEEHISAAEHYWRSKEADIYTTATL